MEETDKEYRKDIGIKMKLDMTNWTKWKRVFLNDVKSKDKHVFMLLSQLRVPNFDVPGINDEITVVDPVSGANIIQRAWTNNAMGREKRAKMVTDKEREERNYKKTVPIVVA